jgi:hypothetical protein
MINGATVLRVPRETRRKTGIGAFGKFAKGAAATAYPGQLLL